MAKETKNSGTMRHVIGLVKDIPQDNSEYDIVFVCSTNDVDRSGEIIDQAGWLLDNFRLNPVMLAAHQHRLSNGKSSVIGSWVKMEVVNNELLGYAKFANTELGQEYKTLYLDGHMRAVSVGFWSIEGGQRENPKTRKSVYVHTKCELIEVSAVAVGCNHLALAQRGLLNLEAPLDDDVLAKVQKQLDDHYAKINAAFTDAVDEIKALLPDPLYERSTDDDDLADDIDDLDTNSGGDEDPEALSQDTVDAAKDLLHELGM